MAYTLQHSRREAACSPHRRSHKISGTGRGVLRVRERQNSVGTLVPVGTDAVEQPYAIFDQRDSRVWRSGICRVAPCAIPTGGRAS
jgi:hypothetical protein